MSERIQVPTTQLFNAMEAKLAAEQAAPQVAAETAASEETARIIAEREKQAAELQRAWQNPTVMAKFREREAGLVADTAEVRDVIAQSQVDLAGKERRNPSNALEGEGRVETHKVTGIHGKVIHNTKGGFARDFARDAATDPRHFAQSGRKARQELNREVNDAASEKSLTRRIGTLKKELAQAQDNQEDFKARQLEKKLTEAREELVVQRALSAERKAAEAKKAAEERAATIAKGVRALDKDERKRSKAGRVDRRSVDAGALAVLDGLNGTKPNKPVGQAADNPTDTAEVTPPETEKPAAETPDPELAALDNNEWSYRLVSRIDALAEKANLSIRPEDQDELTMGIVEARQMRANTQAELEEIAQMAVSYVAAKQAREAAAREAESYAASVPGQVGASGAGGREARVTGDTFHAPESDSSSPEAKGNKLTILSAVAEKPDPEHGEDAHIVDDNKGLYVVIDGMDGYRYGREAAQAITRGITDEASHIYDEYGKPDKVSLAERDLADMFWAGAGALNEANLSSEDGAVVAAVQMVETKEGLYMVYRGAGDALIKVFREGTVIGINKEQVAPNGTSVTNVINPSWRGREDDFGTFPLQEGDRILICSDGITGDKPDEKLTGAEWADAFGQIDPQASANRFIELSKKRDDKTAVVLFVGEGNAAPQDAAPEPPVAKEDGLLSTSAEGVVALEALLNASTGIPAPKSGRQDKRFEQVRTFLANSRRRTNDRVIDALSWVNRRRGRTALVVGALATAVGVGIVISHLKQGGDASTIAGLVQPPKSGSGSGSGEAAAIVAQKAAEKAQRLQELGVVNVPKGGTYIDTIGQWTAARGVKMNGAQSTEMYHHLAQLFPDGNFFTEAGESYSMGVGEFGINKSGTYHVRPEVMAAIAQKAQEMGIDAEDILTKLK